MISTCSPHTEQAQCVVWPHPCSLLCFPQVPLNCSSGRIVPSWMKTCQVLGLSCLLSCDRQSKPSEVTKHISLPKLKELWAEILINTSNFIHIETSPRPQLRQSWRLSGVCPSLVATYLRGWKWGQDSSLGRVASSSLGLLCSWSGDFLSCVLHSHRWTPASFSRISHASSWLTHCPSHTHWTTPNNPGSADWAHLALPLGG